MADAEPQAPSTTRIIAPTEAEWRAMSLRERELFLEGVNDALSDPALLMTEGRSHKKAKTRAIDALGLHFRTIGRAVYLAEEMAVVYPGEVVFSPDVLAVVGVEEPEDDERMAWVVVDEGRGVDFVLEVLHHGNRRKDLVDNVERYAKLGIPEYFVYDRLNQKLFGYRLADGLARSYERMVPQLGLLPSVVLGLGLAIRGGALRFFSGVAELPGTSDLIGRLNGMVDDLQARADEAQARAVGALHALREGLTAVLLSRRLGTPDELEARVRACDDAAELQRWLLRATNATTVDDVFAADEKAP